MKPRFDFPLVGVLGLTLLLELGASRLGMRLASDFLVARSAQQVLAYASAFTFHAASLLSLVLAAMAILRLLGQPSPVAPGAGPLEVVARATTVVAMVGFLFIAAVGVWMPLPGQLRLYLVALFAILVVQVVRSAWPSTIAQGRARSWLGLWALAVVAHLLWMAVSQLGGAGLARPARLVLAVGEALAVTAAASAPVLLLARGARPTLAALAGLVVTALAVAVSATDWMLAAKIAAYGFGVELPPPLPAAALLAVALGAWVMATVALLAEPGPSRLRGWGLLALGLSGYQLELPYQVCSSVIGLLCVVESYHREGGEALPAEAWRRLLQRLAAAVGAAEAVVVGAPGHEEARAAGNLDGVPAVMVAERRGGRLSRLRVVVGHVPDEAAPPLALFRRGGPRLGRGSGAEVATGDQAFDATFVLLDARRLAAGDPLLDDGLRPRLREVVDGWLGVWPGQAVELRSVHAATFALLLDDSGEGERALLAMLTVLGEARRRGAES